MPANLGNSAVATGQEKVSFYSNPKEGQCQRMFKVPNNCTHFTCYQRNAQNSPRKTSKVHEPRTSRCSRWIEKRQRNMKSNCQHPLEHKESKRIPEKKKKTFISSVLTKPKPLTVWITSNCGKFLKR